MATFKDERDGDSVAGHIQYVDSVLGIMVSENEPSIMRLHGLRQKEAYKGWTYNHFVERGIGLSKRTLPEMAKLGYVEACPEHKAGISHKGFRITSFGRTYAKAGAGLEQPGSPVALSRYSVQDRQLSTRQWELELIISRRGVHTSKLLLATEEEIRGWLILQKQELIQVIAERQQLLTFMMETGGEELGYYTPTDGIIPEGQRADWRDPKAGRPVKMLPQLTDEEIAQMVNEGTDNTGLDEPETYTEVLGQTQDPIQDPAQTTWSAPYEEPDDLPVFEPSEGRKGDPFGKLV